MNKDFTKRSLLKLVSASRFALDRLETLVDSEEATANDIAAMKELRRALDQFDEVIERIEAKLEERRNPV